MWWRLSRAEFNRHKGEANKQSMKELVASGATVGILAYAEGEPIGWCGVAPRESYPVLERSRVLKRIDDEPVWSVTCLFVKKDWRKRRVSVRLLRAAIDYVRACGGSVVEGYPVEPKAVQMPDVFAWTGLVSAFKRAGFVEMARGSPTRPMMRFQIKKAAAKGPSKPARRPRHRREA
ncbi:MAG TPA: GNAT family N-acetyltransferase [Gemmatales bacterium]|nr:GNAT family N-acetyltransferase [Gemmatales bacterium]HMP59732.1 GNAT family N-acetyltransferase [Gemmatales bacterium]